MRRRFGRVHKPSAIGSPARLMMLSIGASSGIWARLVTRRNGGRSSSAFFGSRTSTVT